ncbi:MAG TPA: SRPBCC domain-containing protein [Solirubrobacteraceae bacterium]|nr:SRPBCC domain-containing protein [Solirubrobacteraceae bacterium]
MPTAVVSRSIAASPPQLWRVVGDPHHLPRWWPRVTRVEGVQGDAFTEVLAGRSGKVVRADFEIVDAAPPRRVVWSQQVQGTPFEKVLLSAVTQIDLDDAGSATEVRIELRQELPGLWGGSVSGVGGVRRGRMFGVARFGSPLVNRAATATLQQALDGLARVFGDA